MTEGRFEAKVHGSGGPLDARPHWSTFRRNKEFPFRKFSEETQYKESCPFHDLRAEGQFQPEVHGSGGAEGAPNTDFLLRKPGGRLNCSLTRNHGVGCGGGKVPIDSTPQPRCEKARGDKPWTCTTKPGVFSTPPYQAAPPPQRPHPKARPQPPAHFQSGLVSHPHAPYPHMHEHRQAVTRERPSRLATGRTSGQFDGDVLRGPRAVTAPAAGGRTKPLKPLQTGRMTTNIRGTLQGTFTRYPAHHPDAYQDVPVKPRGDDSGKVKKKLRPIYTWACKSKRTMPISSAWTVTKAAPEP